MPERNKFLESICEKYSKELNEYYTYKEVLWNGYRLWLFWWW
jgi:hypothetical protein